MLAGKMGMAAFRVGGPADTTSCTATVADPFAALLAAMAIEPA